MHMTKCLMFVLRDEIVVSRCFAILHKSYRNWGTWCCYSQHSVVSDQLIGSSVSWRFYLSCRLLLQARYTIWSRST